MSPADIAAWSDFGVGVAGAMAALTGLLFVAISINLERIVAAPSLPRLAASTLLVFSVILLAAICLLIPGQHSAALGVELLVLGLAVGSPAVWLQTRPPRITEHTTGPDWFLTRLGPAAAAPGLTCATGVGLLLGWSGSLYLLAGATVLSIAAGLIGAWILLVEILR